MPAQGRTPGRTIRVAAPDPAKGMSSGRLFIGRGLYAALGSPRRVMLLNDGGRALIRPGDEYGVVVPATGQPRVSLGEAARELLGLDAGTYPATVEDGRIVVPRPGVAGVAGVMAPAAPPAPPAPPALVPSPPRVDDLPRGFQIRGRETTILLRVTAHEAATDDDGRPVIVVIAENAGDTVEVVSGWPSLARQLRVGDTLRVTIDRLAGPERDTDFTQDATHRARWVARQTERRGQSTGDSHGR